MCFNHRNNKIIVQVNECLSYFLLSTLKIFPAKINFIIFLLENFLFNLRMILALVWRKTDISVFKKSNVENRYGLFYSRTIFSYFQVQWLFSSNYQLSRKRLCHSQKKILTTCCYQLLLIGKEFWVVRGDTMLPGYPQKLYTLGFSKDVSKIDAAFHNGIEGKTYYFIADKFWR